MYTVYMALHINNPAVEQKVPGYGFDDRRIHHGCNWHGSG